MRVLIDTSALIFAFENRFDLFTELRLAFPRAEIVIPEPVLRELEHLGWGRMLNYYKNKFKIVKSELSADDAIFELAREGDAVITMDKKLRRRLRSKGVKVFAIRKGRLWEC